MSASLDSSTVREETSGYVERWRRHNEDRNAAIITAALELLDEIPARAELSVQDVAKRSGLVKAVVYRHFKGRDDLYAKVRSYIADRFEEALTAKLDLTTGSIEEILRRAVREVADFFADHPHWVEFAAGGPRHDAESDIDSLSDAKLRISRMVHDTLAGLAQLAGADATAFATLPFAVVSMMEGVLRHWAQNPDDALSRDQIVEELAALTWDMIDGRARALGLRFDPSADVPTNLAGLSTPS